MKTTKNKKVLEIIADIKASANPEGGKKNSRYISSQFIELVAAIATDKSHRAQKVIYKNGERLVEEKDLTEGFDQMAHKLLKHAGIKNEEERTTLIDTFEFKDKEIKYMIEIIEEAMALYSEEKFVKLFEDKDLTLSFKSIERTGKYEGQKTFKKKSTDKVYLTRKNAAK